jgi:hypothetical protein
MAVCSECATMNPSRASAQRLTGHPDRFLYKMTSIYKARSSQWPRPSQSSGWITSASACVKAEWFKRYRENELPERFDRIVQSWDTANKATELSDFSVCTTWGVKD